MKAAEGQISDGLMAVQFVMALSFVVGLIFLAAWLIKKYSSFGGNMKSGTRMPVNIISTTPLGDKKFLVVSEVQGEYFFLGVSSGGINLISRLNPPEQMDEGVLSEDASPDFGTLLKKAGGFFKGGPK